jgi:hypothetical protein
MVVIIMIYFNDEISTIYNQSDSIIANNLIHGKQTNIFYWIHTFSLQFQKR